VNKVIYKYFAYSTAISSQRGGSGEGKDVSIKDVRRKGRFRVRNKMIKIDIRRLEGVVTLSLGSYFIELNNYRSYFVTVVILSRYTGRPRLVST